MVRDSNRQGNNSQAIRGAPGRRQRGARQGPHGFVIACGIGSEISRAELCELLAEGVGEVFLGYVPRSWLRSLGTEVSVNRRYLLERQIVDTAHLRSICQTVNSHAAQVMVTLNEHAYAPRARKRLPEIVDTCLDAGAAGFIVADLELLDWLARRCPSCERIVSGEAGVYNVESARLFADHGATRLTFARELKLADIARISEGLADTSLELEAFIAREYCVFSSAFCTVTHGFGQRTHFCCSHTERSLWNLAAGALESLPCATTQWADTPQYREAALSLQRCGLCALEALRNARVKYLKVPGRSTSPLGTVRLLRRVVQTGDSFRERAIAAIDSPEFCSGKNCYYRIEPGQGDDGGGRRRPKASAGRTVPHPRAPCEAGRRELGIYLPVSEVLGRGRAAVRDVLQAGRASSAPFESEAARRSLDLLRRLDPELGPVPAVIYAGLEHCERRLPSLRKPLLELVRAALGDGRRVALVTPIGYQASFSRVVGLVEDTIRACEDAPARLEIIVNDLGLLAYASRHWRVPLGVGRMLNRMKRHQMKGGIGISPFDGFLDGSGLDARERAGIVSEIRTLQEECFGHPHLLDDFYASLLRRLGVGRIETDVLPTPLSRKLDDGFTYSAYLPWCYLTSGRACALAGAVDGEPVSHPTERCSTPCRRGVLVPRYPWASRFIAQRGTAVFMDVSEDAEAFLSPIWPMIQRVVFEPGVPW